MTTVNDEIADALTGHSVGLHRLSNATVRKIIALLNRSDARILERLLKDDMSALSRARQEALLDDLRRIVESAYADATGQLHIDLRQLAAYEVEYQTDMFRALLPIRLETVQPSAEQIWAAVNARPFQGRLLREWYKDISDTAAKRLRDTIRTGIVEGRTVEQMVREVKGTAAQGYKDGILGIGRRQAEAVVRTAVNHTATSAREELFTRNQSLIRAVQWHSVLDGRTTVICMGRDGKTWPAGIGPRPPAHWNCRSTVIPVVKSLRELGLNVKDLKPGTRASMNGQVAADMTYNDWLKKQPVAFQDDVLGKGKAKLFREGGLSLDKFVDRAGNELTLDQLRQREAATWARVFAD